jgi:phage gp36-like protein
LLPVAIPQIKEITVPSTSTVMLWFDGPLDSKVPVPVGCFTVNYGNYGVTTVNYASDTMIVLELDSFLSPWDEVFVSYEPPLDLKQCLRGPVPPTANDVVVKRNAVRAFYRVPARNQLAPDEKADGSQTQSNLGQTIGGYGFPMQNRSGTLTDHKSDPKSASPDDFIVAYGLKEAIQLTNIDDAAATTVNVAKLRMAIQDANSLIDSYIEQSGKAGMVLITSNRRRTALIIARYYLDTVRRREDVKSDYETALKQLAAEMAMSSIRAGNGDSAIDTPAGIMRSWRIPQRYNSVSGKGLSGFTTDTAGDQSPDFRWGWGAINQNLQFPNWITPENMQELTGGTPQILQPMDSGGYSDGNQGWGP